MDADHVDARILHLCMQKKMSVKGDDRDKGRSVA